MHRMPDFRKISCLYGMRVYDYRITFQLKLVLAPRLVPEPRAPFPPPVTFPYLCVWGGVVWGGDLKYRF